MDALCHFTTADGFTGICESKKLWASNLRKLEDPREIVLGYENASRQLADILRSEGFSDYAIQELMINFDRQFRYNVFYSISFTPFGEDAGMWSRYSADATGVCIMFLPEAIFEMPGGKLPVLYVDEEANASDRAIREYMHAALYSVIPRILLHYENDDARALAEIFNQTVKIGLLGLKGREFEYEQEFRVVFAQYPEEYRQKEDRTTYPLRTRTSSFGDVDYLELPYGRKTDGGWDATSAIQEVIIGKNSRLSQDEAVSVLERTGFVGFCVRRAEI